MAAKQLVLGYRLNLRRCFPCPLTTRGDIFKVSESLRRYSSERSEDVYLDYPSEKDPSSKGITYLNLNRPQSRNAISVNLLEQMSEALERVRFDGTRVLILRSSSPGSFCAGADLRERRGMGVTQVSRFLHDLRNALHDLETLPMPTIAAIDGPALGGGLELALACDLRVAGPGATKIGLTETRLGIIPGAGGTQRTARLLGISKTKDLVFGARVIDASEAFKIGLIDYVSESGISASDRATEVASGILPNGPVAIKAAKLAINKSVELDLETGLDFERQCYNSILGSKDRLEGLKAFSEKRQPNFTGE
ncbi:ClpP/crotonase-like domain-containing protein [Phakopsora pachyrhizi]|uniref:ClpP/crotonase-like domain-containing protein n=1 Tax=Phakopsora pachyrhizi TaxID=170000 RepID=A0AAV0B3T5_PHAPC|nr:ClpP/crotonase-like domain-containing protein [Phakopsora pachyrhizi]CAH7676392.1 ClpP/crotonase-like domain-containing protein [Phakopsora pachyrhizi]